MSWPAKFDGTCAGCGEPIRVGQEIRWASFDNPGGNIEHVACPSPEIPCPHCHLVPSTSGRCGCDD